MSVLVTMLGEDHRVSSVFVSVNASHRYAINPARDLGPRLMIFLSGWGWEAFSSHGYWFWIPLVWCHVGGIVGVTIHGAVVEHGWGTAQGESDLNLQIQA